MFVFLQLSSGGASILNLAIVLLVVAFLALPTALLIQDRLRGRRLRNAAAQANPTPTPGREAAVAAGDATKETVVLQAWDVDRFPTLAQRNHKRHPLRPEDAIYLVPRDEVDHSFDSEPVPAEIGYIRADTLVEGPIDFRGHLHIGPRCVIAGGVRVRASLNIDNGAVVQGNVHVGGNLYVGIASEIQGKAVVGGRATCSHWSHLTSLEALGEVDMHEGAIVDSYPRSGSPPRGADPLRILGMNDPTDAPEKDVRYV